MQGALFQLGYTGAYARKAGKGQGRGIGNAIFWRRENWNLQACESLIVSDKELEETFPVLDESAPRDDPLRSAPAVTPAKSRERAETVIADSKGLERQVLLAVSLRENRLVGEGASLVVGSMHCCCNPGCAERQKRQSVRALSFLQQQAAALGNCPYILGMDMNASPRHVTPVLRAFPATASAYREVTGEEARFTAFNKNGSFEFKGTLDYILFHRGGSCDGEGGEDDGARQVWEKRVDDKGKGNGLSVSQVLAIPLEVRTTDKHENMAGSVEISSIAKRTVRRGAGSGACVSDDVVATVSGMSEHFAGINLARGLPSGIHPSDHLMLAARFVYHDP